MINKYLSILLFLCVLFFCSNVTFSAEVKYKFGQGFKVEKPTEIYSESLLNVRNLEVKDNSTTSLVDPIKNTLKLSNLKNETNTVKPNDDEEEIGFKKLEEATPGTNPMFPDREFRGSQRPDFCNTGLGLTFGE
jgi:uncharacterized protein (UPF0333 family)